MFNPIKKLMLLPQEPEQVILDLRNQNQIQFVTINVLRKQLDEANEKIQHLEVILADILAKNDSIFLIKK